MAQFVIRPAGDPDWANARFLSGTPPMTAVDAATLGIAMGTDYEIGRLGDLAVFRVTDVPAAMAAPSLAAGADQITLTLPADPATGGRAITGRDLRHRTGAAAWTTVTGVTSPHTLTGLAGNTAYEVQVRAVNANGPGAWSASASATTQPTGDTTAPVVNSISYASGVLTVDLTEASGTATAVWAAADPVTDPTYTTGGGWVGTTYETGSFTVTSGGDSDTISLSATPQGPRELTLYFHDAAGNLSAVQRIAFTMPDSTAPVLSAATGTQTGASTATWGVTSNEAGGTIHAAAYPGAATAPSAAQVVAGTGGGIVAASSDTTPTADSSNGGSFSGLSGGTSYRAAVVHVDAAGNQSAVVTSAAFTTAAASLTQVQSIDGGSTSPSGNSTSYESLPITIGSGANRLLVAAFATNTSTNATALASLRATFGAAGRAVGTGTPMTLRGAYNASGRRTQVAFAILAAPASGAGTVQIDSATSMQSGLMQLYEFTGAHQTLASHAALTAVGGANQTSLTTSGTVAAGTLLSVLSILGNNANEAANVAATGGATLARAVFSGATPSLSDVTAGFSRETVTAGTDGNGFTWTTAADADMASLNIIPA